MSCLCGTGGCCMQHDMVARKAIYVSPVQLLCTKWTKRRLLRASALLHYTQCDIIPQTQRCVHKVRSIHLPCAADSCSVCLPTTQHTVDIQKKRPQECIGKLDPHGGGQIGRWGLQGVSQFVSIQRQKKDCAWVYKQKTMVLTRWRDTTSCSYQQQG